MERQLHDLSKLTEAKMWGYTTTLNNIGLVVKVVNLVLQLVVKVNDSSVMYNIIRELIQGWSPIDTNSRKDRIVIIVLMKLQFFL